MHRGAAGACGGLIDEARTIEKSGVTYANLDKIGGLLSSLASRAIPLPQDEFPLGAEGGIYRLSEDPDTASRSMPRPVGPARKCRRTIIRPGPSSPASTAPSATSSTQRLDNGAAGQNVCSCARATVEGKDAASSGDLITFRARRFPPTSRRRGAPAMPCTLHFYGLSLEHLAQPSCQST